MPARSGATSVSAATVSGMKLTPAPMPISTIGPSRWATYVLDVSSPASQRLAAPTSTTPVTTSGRTPNRPTRRGVRREVAKISRVSGRNAKPERSAPYPSTPCMNCTAKKKNANCAPTKSAITETAPTRIRLRSRSNASSGDATRRSLATKPASSTTASANAPTVPTEVQPWSGALMKPKTRLAEPRVAVTAPVTSKRPGWRGVSSTKRCTRTSTSSPSGTLMNSDQRHDA